MNQVSKFAFLSAKVIGRIVLGCCIMVATGATIVLLQVWIPDGVATVIGAIGTAVTFIVVTWLVLASVGDKLGAARQRNRATEDIVMATCPRCEDSYPAEQRTCPVCDVPLSLSP